GSVARGAALADHAAPVGAAQHVLRVRVAVVALQRRVAAGMAVLAARVLEDAAHGLERGEASLGARRAAGGGGGRGAAAGADEEAGHGGGDEAKDGSMHGSSVLGVAWLSGLGDAQRQRP